MTNTKEENLKQRIIDEMSVDYADSLERNFDLAKQFIRITSTGKVDLAFKEKIAGREQILLYLIGKIYAKKADFTDTEMVENEELMSELGIGRGSLLPWIKFLRDEGKIKTMKKGQKALHSIPMQLVEKTLKEIEKKIKEKT
ncbi:MAG: hypothetical protein JW984_12350 [Deltaproteobacteria bacterium]|uniref:Uncharacterized protein n=1 Tax=Candidatus Zymogenus saltonus TaxID=2844893 RepID=A0A9D8PQ60_9DELT|nr:hypothetical protein [Candidatus Zymogenus saltonus]